MKNKEKQLPFIVPGIIFLFFALSITAFFYVFAKKYTDFTFCLVVVSIALEFFFMPFSVLLCAGKSKKSAATRSVIAMLAGLAVMLPITYLFNNILYIGSAETALISAAIAFITVAVPFFIHITALRCAEKGMKLLMVAIAVVSAACLITSGTVFAVIPARFGTYKTETVKIDKGDTKMIAHRGLSALEIENTCAAFTEAGKRSYFGIESDLHRTADGEYVIIHDENTGRVAKTDRIVANSTVAELREIVLNDKNGRKGRDDLLIPTLSEYISICKEYNKIGILELKASFTPEEIEEIVEIIKQTGYYDNIIFISFDLQNLITLREQNPDAKAQYLTGEYTDELMNTLLDYNLDIDIHHSALTKEIVDAFHASGIEVNCWTCDDVNEAQKLIGWGVDYITTNILE